MALHVAPYRADDLPVLRALLQDPALAAEFDTLLEPDYLDHKLADPLRDRDSTLLARADRELAGFCIAFLLPRAEGGVWAMLRIGVAERFRRRGIASALLEAARRVLERRPIPGGLSEIVTSAWRPNPGAGAFAARRGFRPVRQFWQMARGTAGRSAPSWPRGVTLRTFDGSEQALADWNRAYNSSFPEHYHFVPPTLDLTGRPAAAPLSR